jgi:hypothetical protein
MAVRTQYWCHRHETPDTDPGFVTAREGANPYPVNIHNCCRPHPIELWHTWTGPGCGRVIVCSFPKLKDAQASPPLFRCLPND